MKDSWDAEGQNVMNAAQYAFSSVTNLAKAMGRSFLEVWTNGTGEQFCTNILRLVTLVSNIIGDIAGAFTRAWEEGGRGTALIQSIFDRLNSWLELIHSIGESFRDVWNSGTGESMIGHILDSFTQINDTITHIRDNFRKAWELDGTGTAIIQNLADILDGLLGSIDRITESLSDWSSKLDFTPIMSAFKRMSEALKPVGDKLGGGLEWLFVNVLEPLGKWAIEQAIPAAMDTITAGFDAFNAVLDVLKPLGEWLWENMLKPLASWTGGTIMDIIRGITDVFRGLTNIFTEISSGTDWNTIGLMLWEGLVGGISSFGVWAWEKIKEIFWGIVDTVKELLGIHSPSTVFMEIGGYLVEGFIKGISQVWVNVVTIIGSLMSSFMDTAREIIGLGLEAISAAWKAIWSGIKTFAFATWENIKNKASEVFTAVKDKLAEIWNNVKLKIEQVWSLIRLFVFEQWGSLKDKAVEIFESIRDKLSEIWDSVKQTIEEKWNAIRDWFGEIWQKIKDIFKLDEMLEIGKGVMTKLWDGLKSVWEDVKSWLTGIIDFIGNAWNKIVEGAKNLFRRGKEEAESESSGGGSDNSAPSGGKDPGYVDSGPGVKGHATGGFPKSGQMFVANENGKPEMIGSWGGKAAVANNMQITQGITAAVQGGMRSAIAPLVSTLSNATSHAAPPLAMVGSAAPAYTQEDRMQEMVDKAMAMTAGTGMSDQYLAVMVELLKKIIDLIENLELTVNFDVREIKKKLTDLEKRSGYSLRTT